MKHWTQKKTPSEYVDTARIGKKVTAEDFIRKQEVKHEDIKL